MEEPKKFRIKCNGCGAGITFKETLLGRTKPCPKCGCMISFNADDAVEITNGEAPEAQTDSPNSINTTPERMKANKAIAGDECASCGREIELGDEIYMCPSCNTAMHYQCYTMEGRCLTPSCADNQDVSPIKVEATVASTSEAEDYGDKETKECPQCGETILKKAKKCKYCKSILDANMRRRMERNKAESSDDKLSTGEIIFGLLCGGIACIIGIVWGCMGKKKGWKLVGLAIISQIVWTLIRAAIEIANGH